MLDTNAAAGMGASTIISVRGRKRKTFHKVGFEVFTTVNMKNAVFWDIKSQFVHHRRHITSPLQSPAS
jgi:hypothetical protein